MRIIFAIILISVVVAGGAQSNPRQYLLDKAESFLDQGNIEQARYHYMLALKQKGDSPSDESIKQTIVHLDSAVAYESSNQDFLALIKRADSLKLDEKYIEALKFFDDASTLEPSLDYPHARIDQIIAESDEIKKKLMIYNAKQNQLNYQKILKDIEKLEDEGFKVEAYFKYIDFSKAFHGDSIAKIRSERLYQENSEQIDSMLKLIKQGGELYSTGEFKLAEETFKKALNLNPKCQICSYRLEQITYCLKNEINLSDDLDHLMTEARQNFKQGKYEKAYYQFSWLQKKKPGNVEVDSYVVKLGELIEAETDERMRRFNADIALEKANEAFMDGKFEEALINYLKIKNAYQDVVDYIQFVDLRIAECLSELEN